MENRCISIITVSCINLPKTYLCLSFEKEVKLDNMFKLQQVALFDVLMQVSYILMDSMGLNKPIIVHFEHNFDA